MNIGKNIAKQVRKEMTNSIRNRHELKHYNYLLNLNNRDYVMVNNLHNIIGMTRALNIRYKILVNI